MTAIAAIGPVADYRGYQSKEVPMSFSKPAGNEDSTPLDQPGQPGRTPLRVVVVDIDASSADTLGEEIGVWGHDVRWISDIEIMIQVALDHRANVLLMDVDSAGLPGCRAAHQIRRDRRLRGCFIIAFRPRTGRNCDVEYNPADFDLYLSKPVDLAVLQTILLLEAERLESCRQKAFEARFFDRLHAQAALPLTEDLLMNPLPEVTIYDVHRTPRIYIADDEDRSIYTWDGHAVACLVEDQVFGWRGRHIGWLVDGVLYDLKGFRVGFTAAACDAETFGEPGKYTKHRKAARLKPRTPQVRPGLSTLNSLQDMDAFIRQDAPSPS
jgi:CheY-like chemotaxis protein